MNKPADEQAKAFFNGVRVFGFFPSLICAMAAAKWGAFPGECFLMGLILGGLAGVLLTPKRQAIPQVAPRAQRQNNTETYQGAHFVFGRREGVEL